MKGRKVLSFIILNIELLAVYFITLFKSPDILKFIGIAVITALITNIAIFIGGNTYDKWIRSRHFKKELYNEDIERNIQ